MKHLFLTLFFFCNFLISGFEQSTIVLRETDHIPISSMTKNDQILAFDSEVFCLDPVAIGPIKILVDSYVVIDLLNNDCPIICSRFQRFLTINNEWKKAIDLSVDDCLQGAESVFIQSISVINEPIILYDLCVVPHHTFCVGKQKVVAHNFVPFIVITFSWFFGAGTAFEWTIFGGIAAGIGVLGCAMNKNNKKKKVTVKPIIKPNQSGNGTDPDKNDDDNERKFNIISKTVFFKKVKDKYRYDKQTGLYKRIKDKEGLKCTRTGKDIEFLEWDGQHGDVEAYSRGENHLGSIRPSDGVMYKGPRNDRQMYKKK
jgi:hypothetical protein